MMAPQHPSHHPVVASLKLLVSGQILTNPLDRQTCRQPHFIRFPMAHMNGAALTPSNTRFAGWVIRFQRGLVREVRLKSLRESAAKAQDVCEENERTASIAEEDPH